MKAADVLIDFLKYAGFGDMQPPAESNVAKSNLIDSPIISGQPPRRPTIVATSPINPGGNVPATAPVKPATNPHNFKIK
jgi:hypothetical protein